MAEIRQANFHTGGICRLMKNQSRRKKIKEKN